MGSKWENLPVGEDSRSSPAPGALLGPRRQSQTVRGPAWPGWGRVGKEPEGGPVRSRHAGSHPWWEELGLARWTMGSCQRVWLGVTEILLVMWLR